ncbi:TonB-dependent receptor [Sphingobium sp. BS19]|uniref:TonB-dependent receptor n=1 Tax=Sphingobium sp. BS19 TaxID=3018973 RepID=UPI0022EEB813|nr:TonB-dependent receptor [Sphingobium sp. BS19]GLJ00248.1 TonB-dependent receptor [Sphingobium sp. BS19]
MKITNKKVCALVAALSASTALVQQPVFAQSKNDNSADNIEDIVVTAQRRDERLQNVPVAVTALDAGNLQSVGANDVRQLAIAVPGFSGGRNFAVFQPNIRGVGSTGVSLGDEANVALYIDGVYQPNALANLVDLVAVDRVEVLRGPQGTLFGRNATGGLINVITPDPKFTPEGRVLLQYGHLLGANDINVRAYATGGLTDTIAADISAIYRYNDGYLDDLVSGGTEGQARAINTRGKLLFQPGDRTKVVVTLAYLNQLDNGGNSSQPIGGNSVGYSVPGAIVPDTPFNVALSIDPVIKIRSFSAAIRTAFDLGAVSFETTGAYTKDRVNQESDSDTTPLYADSNQFLIHNRVFSQEVRLLSQNESRLQWIVGGYFYDLDGHTTLNRFLGTAPRYSSVTRTVNMLPRATVSSLAVFAEGTYGIFDPLKLILGVRYTSEKRGFGTTVNGVDPFPHQSMKANKWTYRATANYQIDDRTLIYVTYSTGYKSGVYNTYGTSPVPTEPETIASYEVGLKSDPLSWLRTNISLFSYDYKDLQVSARAPAPATGYLLQNAANARIRGAELEAQIKASRNLSFRFAGSLLNAKYKSFPGAQSFIPIAIPGTGLFSGNATASLDVANNRMTRAPKYTLSLSGDWRHALSGGSEIHFNANAFHSARVFFDFANRLSQSPYTLLNAEIKWVSQSKILEVSIFGRNLTNARIYQQASANSFGDFVTYERPLYAGMRIGLNF